MLDNYVLAKALALYTGSRSLLNFMEFINNSYASEEVMRCVKRLIVQCLPANADELENVIAICITKNDIFFEVNF